MSDVRLTPALRSAAVAFAGSATGLIVSRALLALPRTRQAWISTVWPLRTYACATSFMSGASDASSRRPVRASNSARSQSEPRAPDSVAAIEPSSVGVHSVTVAPRRPSSSCAAHERCTAAGIRSFVVVGGSVSTLAANAGPLTASATKMPSAKTRTRRCSPNVSLLGWRSPHRPHAPLPGPDARQDTDGASVLAQLPVDAGGGQRFRPLQVRGDAQEQPVAEEEMVPGPEVHLGAAAAPASAHVDEGDHVVARVEQLLDLHAEGLPVLAELGEERPHLVVPVRRLARDAGEVRPPLDIGIDVREHALDVATVPRLVEA